MPDDSTPAPEGDYTESGVPGFDFVRDRIENRFATALGSTELAGTVLDALSSAREIEDRRDR